MIKLDASALQCDLAETYRIYDMKELPLQKVALFSYGLRDNSRIKLRMAGLDTSFETLMLVKAVDHLALIQWLNTSDARTGKNRPESMLMKILKKEEKEKETLAFSNGEEFQKKWKEITEKGEKNGK